eukprot:CAMPEP_0201632608 /NCGR_PEP_ID=MMETSP0493-20130528/6201_1 /ASSEMBLY_ACC=CAM_ASM_000838 /TAXON_ID=420259 /ORGANISM="Thalassiosira gravida, Strain GMp14c1" /LENGTH=486 /DNA_ID=CAMNT_0048104167 /DNA_START=25 /DNA_END=1482 /DNA_ORIENTATION=-
MTSSTQEVPGETNPFSWFDQVITPLNACSLETSAPIPVGPEQAPDDDDDDGKTHIDSRLILPLVIGCYQLNEGSSSATETNNNTTLVESEKSDENADDAPVEKSSRSGELRLYMIPSASSESESNNQQKHNDGIPKNNEALSFGDPSCVVKMESGVLDGKWRRRDERLHRTTTIGTTYETMPLYASACASGRIHLHSLENNNPLSWNLSHLTSSEETSSVEETSLCLSLAWNDFIMDGCNDSFSNAVSDRIVSSYSNGTVAIHNISCSDQPGNEEDGRCNVNIEETNRWNAHTMFGCPSEVWTCSFLRGDENVVLSGADDSSLKIWDIRQTQRPSHKIGDSEFEAGVTAITPHPALDHIFAAGSYDENVRIYDHRKMDQPLEKVCVGGGVWRIKWHPSCWGVDGTRGHCGKMLVAAMHGGCRVVNVPTLVGAPSDENMGDAEILSKFTAHESMAYGADWIWFDQSSCEGAASCSFYDRQAFIWNSS